MQKYPKVMVNFIFFTDEKVFTVAAPINSQNDRFYVRSGTRKKDVDENRLLRTRPTFSKSVMVSVGVSKLGCTAIHFVEPSFCQKLSKLVEIWRSSDKKQICLVLGGGHGVERCSMSTYTGVTNCQKQSGFLAHPAYVAKFDFEMSKEYAGDSRNFYF